MDLFGAGGTFGRPHFKHCSTWDIESDLPPSPRNGRNLCAMANRRREEALANAHNHQGSMPSTNDRAAR